MFGSGPLPQRTGVRRHATLLSITAFSILLAACGGDSTTEPVDLGPDPCQDASAIQMGQSQLGTLGTGDCFRNGSYQDAWTFALSEPTIVRIDLESDQFDALLNLNTSAGVLIQTNDDVLGTNSRIVRELGAGEYQIVATSFFDSETGSYELSLSEGGDCTPVGTLGLGGSQSGTVAENSCLLFDLFPTENWTFELAAATNVRFSLSSTDFLPAFFVLDSTDEPVALGFDNAETGTARADVDLEAGSYTIAPHAGVGLGVGNYTLEAAVAPDCSPGTALTDGVQVDGTIGEEDCLLQVSGYADSYVIELTEPDTLAITMTTDLTGPLLLLRDSRELDVAVAFPFQDASGPFTMRAPLRAGSYTLFATAAVGLTGAFSLDVTNAECMSKNVSVGQTVQDTLSSDDCQLVDEDRIGARQQEWLLTLATSTTVQIDMSSDSIDSYLSLLNLDGAELASNDDRDFDTFDARIDRTLSAGQYRVVATTFSPGERGPYQLSLTMLTASAQAAMADRSADKIQESPLVRRDSRTSTGKR